MSKYKQQQVSRLASEGDLNIDYKDVKDLKNYISEAGKIVPRRITGLPARYQRIVATAIKRARFIGLLPFCDGHK